MISTICEEQNCLKDIFQKFIKASFPPELKRSRRGVIRHRLAQRIDNRSMSQRDKLFPCFLSTLREEESFRSH